MIAHVATSDQRIGRLTHRSWRSPRLRRRALGALASLVLALGGLGPYGNVHEVLAYNLIGCKWSSMPTYYYNHSSGNYYNVNQAAAGNWTATPTNVWLILTTKPYTADMTLYNHNDGNNGYAGWADWWCPFGIFNNGYADARSNNYYTDGYPYAGQVSNMTHEVGHDLGLNHNDPPLCGVPVMYLNMDRYFVCGIVQPQTDDINGVRSLYG